MKKILSLIILVALLQNCTTKIPTIPSITDPQISNAIKARSIELNCDLTINPDDSFYRAFNQMSEGQLLCLQDGVYQQVLEIPDGFHVRALNDGQAEIDGRNLNAAWKALLMLSGDNSSVRGLKVHHASTNAKACSITGNNNTFNVMSCSHGGSYKHAIPMVVSGSGNLIENSWFYGEGRYLLMCYQGDNMIIRGNVFRWDKTKSGEPNEPNAAMSNYSCSDTIWENNISLDYAMAETYMKHCGDICMSTTYQSPNMNVQFLGNIVINHNYKSGNSKALRADQKGANASSNILVRDLYVRDVSAGIVVNPVYQNFIVENCTMLGVANKLRVKGLYSTCIDDADIQFKYVNGVKTQQPLWPWPNEALIKRDMCDPDERQSEWCYSGKTLTEYVLDH